MGRFTTWPLEAKLIVWEMPSMKKAHNKGRGSRFYFQGLPENLWVKKLGLLPQTPGFFKAWLGCPTEARNKHPGRSAPPGAEAPLAHRRAEYPLPGCVPAEPGSVSSAFLEFSEVAVKLHPVPSFVNLFLLN